MSETQLETYLPERRSGRTLNLSGDDLEKAIEQAISYASAGAQLQRDGQIAPGPPPEFFDPLAIALPTDLEAYRRAKRRPFARVNAPLDNLWRSL